MSSFLGIINERLIALGFKKKVHPWPESYSVDIAEAWRFEISPSRNPLRVEAGAYFILKNWQTLSIVQTFKGSEKRVPICLQGLFFTGTELDNIMVFPEHAFILYKLDSPLITGYQNLSVYDIYNKLDSGEWIELSGKLDWSLESKKEGNFRDRGKTMERISR